MEEVLDKIVVVCEDPEVVSILRKAQIAKIIVLTGTFTLSVNKLIGESLMGLTKEYCGYRDYQSEDHFYNLSAPTTQFDRAQQRRKAMIKNHATKQPKGVRKGTKQRERRFVSIRW